MGFGLEDANELLNKGHYLEAAMANIDKPSLPEVPNVVDFENFATGAACVEASIKHTAITLKLRSSHLGGEIIVDRIEPILKLKLGMPSDIGFELPQLSGFNMDLSISKITAPKISDIPICLADTLSGKLSTKGPGLMGDILDPFNSAVGSANKLTGSANKYINSALNSFTGSMNSMIKSANNVIKKVLADRINPADLPLFEMIDSLSEYLVSTNYLNDYKDWRDITRCIESNCRPLKDSIMQDDFLWYDKNKTKFIMPIDMGNGSIRFFKFFEDLTPEQLKECNKLQNRYFQYLNVKRQIAAEAAAKVKKAKVPDDKNPFSSIVSSMSQSRDNIVNNLF